MDSSGESSVLLLDFSINDCSQNSSVLQVDFNDSQASSVHEVDFNPEETRFTPTRVHFAPFSNSPQKLRSKFIVAHALCVEILA